MFEAGFIGVVWSDGMWIEKWAYFMFRRKSHTKAWARTARNTLDSLYVWFLIYFWSLNFRKPFTIANVFMTPNLIMQHYMGLWPAVEESCSYVELYYTIIAWQKYYNKLSCLKEIYYLIIWEFCFQIFILSKALQRNIWFV